MKLLLLISVLFSVLIFFSHDFHPIIAHHLQTKSNWHFDNSRLLLPEQYPAARHISNDKTHGSFPFNSHAP
jgi:hypothetical protein